MELVPGAVIGGKYRIERPLARGGMGSLFVARHVQLGSTVAIKFLDPTFATSPVHRARFEREARSAANLKSPHVVHVQDYGFEGDAPYIVMELLEGEDLAHRLHRVRRMSLHDAARVLAQVGKALRKAHEAGVAHRDLKPANLFLARVDDDEVVKILDFGIAKEQHATLGETTRTGEVIGSPHYMSPEQVRAERDADHRSDLWSLGIILYRMLVGSLPFPGDQLGPVLAKILTDPIPVPSHAAPDLPRALDAFFARALARDKHQRFQSIGEMVEAFQIAAGGREAFPSISMSIGTGSLPAAAPAPWNPQGTGVLTSSALQTAAGPHAGSAPPPGSGPITASGPHPGPPPISASHPLTGSGPMGGSGPITGSAALAGSGPYPGHGVQSLSTGPVTASGLASTGTTARPRAAGAVIAIGVLGTVAVVGAAVAFFALSGSADDVSPPATGPAATAVAATSEPAPTASVTAPPTSEPAPSTSASAAPATTSTSAAKATSTSTPTSTTWKPKGTPTAKPKEKWF